MFMSLKKQLLTLWEVLTLIFDMCILISALQKNKRTKRHKGCRPVAARHKIQNSPPRFIFPGGGSYSISRNISSQSTHFIFPFKSFVALIFVLQQGQIYFLVLLVLGGVGVAVPPVGVPLPPVNE